MKQNQQNQRKQHTGRETDRDKSRGRSGKFNKENRRPERDVKKESGEKPQFKKSYGKDKKVFKARHDSEIKHGHAGDSEMRLNRYIANAGVCSRREADKYIQAGLVTVNGQTVTELGIKVSPSDEVRFDGRRLNPEKKVYLLLNKPKNYVTTTDDPHAEQTVMDLVQDACNERIYPVGRLDKSTTGVLLLTNDGDLSKKLTHPRHNMKKIYQVTLDKPVSKRHLADIAEGIELEDGPIAADAVSYIDPVNKAEIGIEIHSGRNRIVRRIFEHLGYRVKKLDRVLFAGLTKKNVPRGKYRFLSEKEIQYLKMQ